MLIHISITIINLYCDEKIDIKLEENIIELNKKDKELLKLKYVIGYLSSIIFLKLIFIASFAKLTTPIRILLITIWLISFVIDMHYETNNWILECMKGHGQKLLINKKIHWLIQCIFT